MVNNKLDSDDIGQAIRVADRLTNWRSIRDLFKPEFTIVEFPTYSQSDEIKEVIKETDELFPIDGLLGEYLVEKNEIIIYTKAIHAVCEILKLRPHQVTFIVEMHEWAHAMLYQGIPDKYLENERKDYLCSQRKILDGIPNAIHEKIAQLITWQVLQVQFKNSQSPEFSAWYAETIIAFECLERKQPLEYHIGSIKGIGLERILSNYSRIKSLSNEGIWIKGL